MPRRVLRIGGGRLHQIGDALACAAGTLVGCGEFAIQLLERKPGTYFASVDPAFFGYKSRHSLGVVYQRQKRFAEAIGEWRKVLAERADHVPTLVSMGELHIERQEWEKLDEIIQKLDHLPGGHVDGSILRAQSHMARREFEPAKCLLQEAKQRFPNSIVPRVVLSHALLQEDCDLDGAEHALRDVLELDPHHQPTQHNLRVLMARKGVPVRDLASV